MNNSNTNYTYMYFMHINLIPLFDKKTFNVDVKNNLQMLV